MQRSGGECHEGNGRDVAGHPGYRISDLGAVLFDENENDHPQHSVGGKQLQMLFDEGGKGYDAWVAGHTANKSGPRGGFSCTVGGLKELACRACVCRPARQHDQRKLCSAQRPDCAFGYCIGVAFGRASTLKKHISAIHLKTKRSRGAK